MIPENDRTAINIAQPRPNPHLTDHWGPTKFEQPQQLSSEDELLAQMQALQDKKPQQFKAIQKVALPVFPYF